jgi:orotate phosphoribosyltransferase
VIVEDVVTTGGSTKETMAVAREAGAEVIAAAIIDRSGGCAALDVPLHALVDLALPTFAPDACPLCGRGVPLTKPGSRPAPGIT